MKRSTFVNKVLKNKSNTVFVTAEQVENALEIFEALGMLAPKAKMKMSYEDAKELMEKSSVGSYYNHENQVLEINEWTPEDASGLETEE